MIGLAAEQLIAGLRILKIDFWYATYVVYGESSALANAANLGIISVGIGVAVFAVSSMGPPLSTGASMVVSRTCRMA